MGTIPYLFSLSLVTSVMTHLSHCPCLACAGPAPSSPRGCLVNAFFISNLPQLILTIAFISPHHCCQHTSLALDASSLAIVANTDATIVIVALGFEDADNNTIILCSPAVDVPLCHCCNLQLPPKATSQHSCTTTIFQRHCRHHHHLPTFNSS
jgi:hypothetical protein